MADGNNYPWTPQQPLPVRVLNPMAKPTSADPFITKTWINNNTASPIPVAVHRALPVLQAKKFVTQDLSKYLMFPQRIYDRLPWSSSVGIGSPSYTFFSRSLGSAGVTTEDTNMPQANNFGQNNAFIITRIGVEFLSGLLPLASNATDATLIGANAVNDAYSVLTRGAFQLNVNGQGQFFQGLAPLTCLPPPNQFKLTGGIATGNAVADIATSYHIDGDHFSFHETPITIIGGTNFNAVISFDDGALTLPSANNTSKISVYLDGYFMRPMA